MNIFYISIYEQNMDVYRLLLLALISLLGEDRFRTREAAQFSLSQVPPQIGYYFFIDNQTNQSPEIAQRCKVLADHAWLKLPVDERQRLALEILPDGWLRLPRIGSYLGISWQHLGKPLKEGGLSRWRFDLDPIDTNEIYRMAQQGFQPRTIKAYLEYCAEEELRWWCENRQWLPERRQRWLTAS